MTTTKRPGSLAGAPTLMATPPAPSLPVLFTGPCTVSTSPTRDAASAQLIGSLDFSGPGVTELAGTMLFDDEQPAASSTASTSTATKCMRAARRAGDPASSVAWCPSCLLLLERRSRARVREQLDGGRLDGRVHGLPGLEVELLAGGPRQQRRRGGARPSPGRPGASGRPGGARAR